MSLSSLRSHVFSFLLVTLPLSVPSMAGAAEVAPIGSGELKSLSVLPAQVTIRGRESTQQLVVTGHHANQGVRDLTVQATYRSGDAKVVRVADNGLLLPVANGTAQLVVEFEGKSVSVPVTVENTDKETPINFTNDIIPILTKLGCNTGACHGKAGGQNGFKLSLLGFEPDADYTALVREGRGRRTFASAPEHSLVILKATGAMGHGGGKKMRVNSAEHRMMVNWIAAGLPFGSQDDPRVVSIAVVPARRILGMKSAQQIAVTAKYSNGATADVTCRAEYRSSDDQMLTVDVNGQVQTQDRTGEGSIMVRYLGQVAVFGATMPQAFAGDKFPQEEPGNFIDTHVVAKLKELGVPPSDICADSEFLRRVCIDITGTLPTAAEAGKFLADTDSKKREKLVDELLTRPSYASYFTLKWADILRVKGGTRDARKGPDPKAPVLDTAAQRADAFHGWIHKSIAENKPYDQFVREVITVQGPTSGPDARPQILWYLELKTPQGLVDDTAQAFLGTRIQCAQCHHHPFEKWSQEDYWGLVAFFGRIQWQQKGKDDKYTPARTGEGARIGQMVAYDPSGQVKNPQGKAYPSPRALDAAALTIPPEEDPRTKLVDWMTHRDNPFFARALVNRYWAHFLGRGLVEPIDDLRVTNPPCNPSLLDALARDFTDHKFDLKHLIRAICLSKTYQRSSTANESNKQDRQSFARYMPRRLSAEVLLDAVDQVTASPTEFTAAGGVKFPAGTRAIDLPDAFVSSYFLSVFGKPKRDSACECERESSVTLAQRVHMLNSTIIRNKAAHRAGQFIADPRPDRAKISELYLGFFSRPPTAEELQTIEKHLADKGATALAKNQAYQDILWALLNTKEFGFNH